jgi:hypothetical protein
MYNRHDHYGQTFKEDLEETVQKMLLDVMDTDFKEDVKLNVSKELSAKFERSKQAKEIKETFNISSDAAIKSGLQELISNLVSIEINKRFKNL